MFESSTTSQQSTLFKSRNIRVRCLYMCQRFLWPRMWMWYGVADDRIENSAMQKVATRKKSCWRIYRNLFFCRPGSSDICSGRGQCVCGRCKCDTATIEVRFRSRTIRWTIVLFSLANVSTEIIANAMIFHVQEKTISFVQVEKRSRFFLCLLFEMNLGSDHGLCACDKQCKCYKDWTGDDCSCTTKNDTCLVNNVRRSYSFESIQNLFVSSDYLQ